MASSMSDSKYAHLPGIASDQPDVYETSALPESDQNWTQAESELSDAVDTIHVDANQAAAAFRGKHVRADHADFSDAIRPPAIAKGYVAWSGDLEASTRAPETPSQRLCRLQQEASELEQMLGDKSQSLDMDEKSLLEASNRLQKQLSALQAGMENNESAKGLARLVNLVNSFKESHKSNENNKFQDVLNYELFVRGDQAGRGEQETVAKLDTRLSALEQSVGVDNELMASLRLETNTKTLLDAASVLSGRSRLLDPSYLDQVEGRLAALLQRLSAIAEKRGELEEAEKSSKIAQIYHIVNKMEGIKQTMPQIVDRFAALDHLHQQALNFNTTLNGMDEMQQRLTRTLDSNKDLLVEVRDKMAEISKNTKDNFDQLEKRIQALKA